MNEGARRSLYMAMPLCRIKFYHESPAGAAQHVGLEIDLWQLCEQAGLRVINRLANPQTDIWAYPSAFDAPGMAAITKAVLKQGYRCVPYKRLVGDLGLAISGGREVGAFYHHRPRRQPPEFVRRLVVLS